MELLGKESLISVGAAERLGCMPGPAGRCLVIMRKKNEAGREENSLERWVATLSPDHLMSVPQGIRA